MLSGLLTVALLAQVPPKFVHSSTEEYTRLEMSGFTVFVSPAAMAEKREIEPALARLHEKLSELERILPDRAYSKLKEVRVWVERDNPDNRGAVFHPGVEWLREHGYNPDKVNGVEIGNIRNFALWTKTIQPMMVLHEMAHAYHYLVLGAGDEGAKAAFSAAKESGKYEKVAFVSGGEQRHYGLNSVFEFFAEASESYFGYNDFFPFGQRQLLEFDKPTYEMLVRAWGFPRGQSRVIGSSATEDVLVGLGKGRL